MFFYTVMGKDVEPNNEVETKLKLDRGSGSINGIGGTT